MKINTIKVLNLIFATVVVGLATAVSALEKTFTTPLIESKGYHVGSYGDGAYWITDGLYNSAFVVTNDGVIVIDAPASYASKLPEAIKEITDKPVKYFIYSHHHKDHTGGSSVFGNEVIRVSHELTAQELRRKNDPNRPIPSVTFKDKHTIELGGQRIELSYPGLQHSPGNIFIYLPKQKVVMLIDVLYPGWVPFKDFAVAASVSGYFEAFEQAKEFNFKYFQGGHVGRPGTRDDFDNTYQYITDIQINAKKAIQITNPPLSFTMQNNPIKEVYVPFNTYLEAASELCAQITLQKWRGILNAGDLYTKGHCWTTILDLTID